MKNRRKAYLTAAELDYVAAAKRYLAAILAEKGISESQLEEMTGIPVSTLSRWLSQERGEFMTLADAALICRADLSRYRDRCAGHAAAGNLGLLASREFADGGVLDGDTAATPEVAGGYL
ncbi:helix-turn-helix domain-containing protein [Aeromonas sp. 30P]|uniref:helix-turn-helix domain-containing protein n=1 Tax=Aeromonas sp. 30P TaxID=3452717 RepID=UPI003F79BE59